MEACLLPHELNKLQSIDDDPINGGSFIVHLGDIKDGTLIGGKPQECEERLFSGIADVFRENSPIMPFFIPGDNAWVDCADPEKAYMHWSDHLFFLQEENEKVRGGRGGRGKSKRWPELGANVERNHDQVELFSFYIPESKVLFLGQSLPEFSRQMTEESVDELIRRNVDWTDRNVRKHSEYGYGGSGLRAIVIFTHHATASAFSRYFEYMQEKVRTDPAYRDPFILVLEDGNTFEVQEGYLGPKTMRISTDDTVSPVKITVDVGMARSVTEAFTYDRGCWCSSSHRPTELKKWWRGKCKDECLEVHNLCRNEDKCSPFPCSN